MRKIIITGSTSFIGTELCQWFIDNGDEVYAVCRSSSKGLNALPYSVKPIYADLLNLDSIKNYITTADIFIHLAWQGTGHDGRDVKAVQDENVRQTLWAMQIANDLHCELFVESGSQAEYGTQLSQITEDTKCNPFSEYGKAKLEVWNRGRDYCNSVGMKYLHLRIFSTYGENDHLWTLIMSTIRKMLNNEDIDLSSCTQMWNFLYVKDAVELIGRLCGYAISNQDFMQEVYHIASSISKPLREYVIRIKELTHSNSKLNFGVVKSSNVVSLNVSINKSYEAVHFKERFSYDEVINRIINKFKNQ